MCEDFTNNPKLCFDKNTVFTDEVIYTESYFLPPRKNGGSDEFVALSRLAIDRYCNSSREINFPNI